MSTGSDTWSSTWICRRVHLASNPSECQIWRSLPSGYLPCQTSHCTVCNSVHVYIKAFYFYFHFGTTLQWRGEEQIRKELHLLHLMREILVLVTCISFQICYVKQTCSNFSPIFLLRIKFLSQNGLNAGVGNVWSCQGNHRQD